MKKQYVARVHHLINPKNRLQEAAYQFIKEQQGISTDDYDAYREYIKMRIAALNTQYPSCSPLNISSGNDSNLMYMQVKNDILGSIECVLITGYFNAITP